MSPQYGLLEPNGASVRAVGFATLPVHGYGQMRELVVGDETHAVSTHELARTQLAGVLARPGVVRIV